MNLMLSFTSIPLNATVLLIFSKVSLELFIKEFSVSQMDALTQVMRIKEERENDAISRKIVDNSGFPVSLNFNKHQKNLELCVKNINSFDYINVINIYFHSLLILTQKNDLDEISDDISLIFFSIIDTAFFSSSSIKPIKDSANLKIFQ